MVSSRPKVFGGMHSNTKLSDIHTAPSHTSHHYVIYFCCRATLHTTRLFVWWWGVVLVVCVCVSVSRVLFCVCVCVCVYPVDILTPRGYVVFTGRGVQCTGKGMGWWFSYPYITIELLFVWKCTLLLCFNLLYTHHSLNHRLRLM